MRWKGRRTSTNIEDRRAGSPMRGRGMPLGCGGLLLVIGIALATGQDPAALLELLGGLQQVQQQAPTSPGEPQAPAADDEQAQMVGVVLADTEETWNRIFADMGRTYREPTLVLFRDSVDSGCGFASSQVGPFYCPADSKVYLDLAFFDDLHRRFGAPGDFAQAYVVAHEVGHHVQNLLGISGEVHRAQQQSSQADANALSVRLELQADCLAGVWGATANRERRLLEPGDIEEGLAAAAAIGDDTLQRRARGRVSPESWTHGSSEQRVRWFRRGFESGSVTSCDAFEVDRL